MSSPYETYLRSDRWTRKRATRLVLDGQRCRLCDSTEDLEVHHRPGSYQLIPNESVENDLTTLCRVCHELITDRIRRRRAGSQQLPELTEFTAGTVQRPQPSVLPLPPLVSIT